ncbi:hypothetical protein AVEN_186028-1 [Araneus ventricosus]|uniref:Transposable element Tc1 transposase n=1 Tax=Araneus ventricosus TaxID=182803 RepID=A0A4Y2JER9_ARAVE|nr:hypothetical protein AVEN_186028-1 [Araneus ventricosus]
MSASELGNLVFIDGIMNHALYLNILRDNLKLSAQNLGIGNNFVYYQDNDPKHTALNVRLWCLYNCPQNLKTPPQSPYLNPIEHIWRELESFCFGGVLLGLKSNFPSPLSKLLHHTSGRTSGPYGFNVHQTSIHGGSSMESGFEPRILRSCGRDLTIRPPRPSMADTIKPEEDKTDESGLKYHHGTM